MNLNALSIHTAKSNSLSSDTIIGGKVSNRLLMQNKGLIINLFLGRITISSKLTVRLPWSDVSL